MAVRTPINRRQALRGMSALATAVLAAACGQVQTPAPTTAPAPPKTGSAVPAPTSAAQTGAATPTAARAAQPAPKPASATLLMWLPWPVDFDYVQQMLNTTVKDFESNTPHKLQMAVVPWPEAPVKMVVGQQTGETADLLFPVGGRGTFAYHGFLLPLDDIVYRDLNIAKEDFYSAVLDPWTIRDKLYGFPGQAGIKCYLYRKDFFEEAGISKFPETWEEFTETAIKLTTKNSNGEITRSGFEMGAVPESEQIILHAKQNGIDEYDEELEGKSRVAEPGYMETVTWFLDLQRKHQVAHMKGTATPPGTFSAFAGTAAITYIGPWWVPTVYEKAPEGVAEKLAIAPPLNQKKRVGLMNADGTLSLYAKSKNLDVAVEFLKTFAKEENYIAFHTPLARGKWGTFSGRKSIDSKNKWLQGERLLWESAFRDSLEKGWGDDFGAEHIGYNEVRANIWPRALERALHGLASEQDALKWAAQQMDAITARIQRVKA